MAYATIDFYISPADGWVKVADDPAYLFIKPGLGVPWYLTATASGAPVSSYTAATGTVTFTGLPTAAQTLSIGNEVYTFVASATDPFDVTIGADETETGDNLVTALADSALVTGVNAAGVVTLTAIVSGLSGNAIALSETADNTAVSGSFMTGGVAPVVGLPMRGPPEDPCRAFEKVGSTTAEFYIRVHEGAQAEPGWAAHFGVIRDQS